MYKYLGLIAASNSSGGTTPLIELLFTNDNGNDTSGNGNNATLSNSYTFVDDLTGRAFKSLGNGQIRRIFTSDFNECTIEMNFKLYDNQTNIEYLFYLTKVAPSSFFAYITSGNVMYVGSYKSGFSTVSYNLNINTAYKLKFSVKNTTAKFYMNDSLVNTFTVENVTCNRMDIAFTQGNGMKCICDNIRLYNVEI